MPDNNLAPFFIIGNPRSGTTLLRLMLDAHPYITVPPECGFMMWYYPKYKDWSSTEFDNSGILEFLRDLKLAKKIDSWSLDYISLRQYLDVCNSINYAEVVHNTYMFYANQKYNDTKIWGDKNNYYLFHISELVKLYPNAKFIHLIRDGRDVACSYKELNAKNLQSEFAPKLPNNIYEIAHEWHNNNQRITSDLKSFVQQDNSIHVRYEDIVRNPEIELARLAEFLGMTFHNDMLSYFQNSNTYEPKEFMQWKQKTTQAPQTDSIGRYHKSLTLHQLKEFNEIACQTLKSYNYDF